MSNNYIQFPGIVELRVAACSTLPANVVRRHATGMPVAMLEPTEKLRFVGEPTCKKSLNATNNGQTYTVELQFKMAGRWTAPAQPTAFIVRTAMGETLLIGSRERPYPVVTTEETTGTPSGDGRLTTVTVKQTALETLIPVVV